MQCCRTLGCASSLLPSRAALRQPRPALLGLPGDLGQPSVFQSKGLVVVSSCASHGRLARTMETARANVAPQVRSSRAAARHLPQIRTAQPDRRPCQRVVEAAEPVPFGSSSFRSRRGMLSFCLPFSAASRTGRCPKRPPRGSDGRDSARRRAWSAFASLAGPTTMQ